MTYMQAVGVEACGTRPRSLALRGISSKIRPISRLKRRPIRPHGSCLERSALLGWLDVAVALLRLHQHRQFLLRFTLLAIHDLQRQAVLAGRDIGLLDAQDIVFEAGGLHHALGDVDAEHAV